jgi:hypothetical protein
VAFLVGVVLESLSPVQDAQIIHEPDVAFFHLRSHFVFPREEVDSIQCFRLSFGQARNARRSGISGRVSDQKAARKVYDDFAIVIVEESSPVIWWISAIPSAG